MSGLEYRKAGGSTSAVGLLGRAVELLRRGGDTSEVRRLVEVEVPRVFAPRLAGRTITGAVTGGVATITIAGAELGRCRVVVEVRPAAVDVRLDLAGQALPDAFADVPLALGYPAAELPSDHRWWSDVSGLLLVGELSAGSG